MNKALGLESNNLDMTSMMAQLYAKHSNYLLDVLILFIEKMDKQITKYLCVNVGEF